MIKAIYIIGTIILLFFSFYLLKPLFHLNKLPQTNYVNLNYESIDLKGSILFIMGKYKNIIFVYAKFSRNIFHSIRFSRALVC